MDTVITIGRLLLDLLLVPAAVSVIFLTGFIYHAELASALARLAPWLPAFEPPRTALGVIGFMALAWLASRAIGVAITQGMALRGERPPQLLHELLAAGLLLGAAVLLLGFLVEAPAAGLLATSGMVVAIVGFALRKTIADIFGGIALGLERPFRIGDWVEAEPGVAGRVIEMNWRSTRIETRDRVHVVLPNSRLADGRLTNYSAPRPHYRTQVRVTLPASVETDRAKRVLLGAVMRAPLIRRSPVPDVRIEGFVEQGIAYRVRFWVNDHANEVDCRDAVLAMIDRHLRLADIALPAPPGQVRFDAAPEERSAAAAAGRILAQVAPFRHAAPDTIGRLAAAAERLRVPAGLPLAAAGAAPGALILVTEGALRAAPEPGESAGGSLGPGDLLGLIADNAGAREPEAERLIAQSDTVLLTLRRDDLAAGLLLDPALSDALARAAEPAAPERSRPAPGAARAAASAPAARSGPRVRRSLPRALHRLGRAAAAWTPGRAAGG